MVYSAALGKAPLTHLSVVKSAFSRPEEKDDWKRTAIFHMFTKIGGKNCIMDNVSSIDAVSFKMITKDGLKAIPHSYPYKELWTNSTVLEIK